MGMSLLGLQDKMRISGILICFTGRFTQGIIEELGEAIKKHMEVEDRSKIDIFNVFGIFIEQTQNIKNYCALKENSGSYDAIAGSGIVTIGKTDTGYFIWSGNLIENSDVQALSGKLELLSKMTKDELKKMYKDQIRKDVPPGSSGAGIGLIDISRKASLPLEYMFEEIDDQFSFFELKVVV